MQKKHALFNKIKKTLLNASLICFVTLMGKAHAGSLSVSCADAYGEYFLEGDQVFGRTSEAYFQVRIAQNVLISSETKECINKSGEKFSTFEQLSVVRVIGTPEGAEQEVEIAFLCEEVGESRPLEDMSCVKAEIIRQGPFTQN